jgi:tetratricopeptide (TPR) repeat protein
VRRPTVELAMIVRNGGVGLARCLESALPAVDGIVIGDTGSTDDSVRIARELGARVLEVSWENDFAKARNAVLQACAADWILSLDADEMLDADGAALIPSLVAQDETDAWQVWRWNYVRTLNSRSGERAAQPNPYRLAESRPYPAFTRDLNTLLFRRVHGLYFENAVHETVAKRVRALGLKVAEAPFVIHHFGFVEDSEEERKVKCELYQQLGWRKVRENPQDDWAFYELGLGELEHRRDPAAALACFQRALELNPQLQGAWLYAGICLTRLVRLPEALEHLRRAAQMETRSVLLAEAIGDVYFHSGDCARALRCYEQAAQFAMVSAVIDCKRGACEVSVGGSAAGLKRIEAAVAREPEAGELYEIWAAAALLAGQTQLAAKVARQRLAVGNAPAVSFIVAAGLEGRMGRWGEALGILLDGRKRHPNHAVLEKETEVARERMSADARPDRADATCAVATQERAQLSR